MIINRIDFEKPGYAIQLSRDEFRRLQDALNKPPSRGQFPDLDAALADVAVAMTRMREDADTGNLTGEVTRTVAMNTLFLTALDEDTKIHAERWPEVIITERI